MAAQRDNAGSNANKAGAENNGENGGEDLNSMSKEELQAELAKARSRSSTVEGASTSHTEKTSTTSIVKEKGRVGTFFGNMGKTTVAIGGVVAGALLGVGGTVLYHKRTTRTAVGSTGGDVPEVSIETHNM